MYSTHTLSHNHWINRHPKITQIHGHTHGLDISLLLSSQLPPKSFNDREMPESSPHRHHTYSVSQPLSSYVYLCRNRNPQTFWIHDFICVFHYFYVLNLRQSDVITEVCRNQVHTGATHIFCLTTTVIMCICEAIGTRKSLEYTVLY
jgi:hypothetical protein